MKDKHQTAVIFRRFKNGEIIALFPYETTRYQTPDYMHIGQHGYCDYNQVVRISKLAKPEEYENLKSELESIGYNLKVMQKANYNKMYKTN